MTSTTRVVIATFALVGSALLLGCPDKEADKAKADPAKTPAAASAAPAKEGGGW